MNRKRIFWQLFPLFLLVAVISILALLWFAYRTYSQSHLDQVRADLKRSALLLQERLRHQIRESGFDDLDPICKELGANAALRITIILDSGEVIGDSDDDPAAMDNHANRPEVIAALNGAVGESVRFSDTLQKRMMYVAIPDESGDSPKAIIRTSLPLTVLEEVLSGFQIKLIFASLAIVLALALVSLYFARRISKPLEEMKEGAERFAEGELGSPLNTPDSLELAGLAQALNEMAVQLNDRIGTVVRQRQELEALLSSMAEGVIAVDNDLRILSINRPALDILLAGNADAVVGKSLGEVIQSGELEQLVSATLQTKKNRERDLTTASVPPLFVNAKSSAWLNMQGETIGAVVILSDITDLRKLENIRKDFVANVSHELKTPITSIKGYVETLIDGAIKNSSDAVRFLKVIRKQSDRLDSIIDDLLTLSRLEQSEVECPLTPSPLRSILTDAIEVCHLQAAKRRIELHLECEANFTIPLNPPLMEHAIVNLLDNAIKFSSKGSRVDIGVATRNGQVEILVADHGSGIEREHLGRLFERFYRVDKARSRKLGGTGLGLAIVKHVAVLHGGAVSVTSNPGEGSVFSVTLPYTK